MSFATFGFAYIARPLGAVVLGHFGDRIGRQSRFIALSSTTRICAPTRPRGSRPARSARAGAGRGGRRRDARLPGSGADRGAGHRLPLGRPERTRTPTAHLNAMNAKGPLPWVLTFSYGRSCRRRRSRPGPASRRTGRRTSRVPPPRAPQRRRAQRDLHRGDGEAARRHLTPGAGERAASAARGRDVSAVAISACRYAPRPPPDPAGGSLEPRPGNPNAPRARSLPAPDPSVLDLASRGASARLRA